MTRLAARLLPIRSLAAAVLLCLVTVTPVLAHAELVSSNPPVGSTVSAAPTTVTLSFSEDMDRATSSFSLVAPDGSTVGTGGPAKDGDSTMTLGGLDLAAGTYTVKWTSAAQDGHIERGTFTFTVAEATAAPATPGPTVASVVAAPATPASGSDVLLPIVIGLAIVAVVGIAVLRRSRAA